MDKPIALQIHPLKSRAFVVALLLNGIWINLSEVVRYFALVKPMLNKAFPGDESVATVTPAIFASWMIWDTILVITATAFYWMFLERNGSNIRNVVLAATYFTITIFGLLWLGVINMGLAPIKIMISAIPLAWIEQIIAAGIVLWALKKAKLV